MRSEEIKLLQASRKGDAAAFEQIVKKYQSLVCAITFSGTGRLDISEELAQETFLKAWKNLHQLKDFSGFRAWLCTIARNLLKNYYRRKKPTFVDTSCLDSIAKQAPTPSETIDAQEELAMLQHALLQIPDEYREPLVLYYRQEKSTRQVAVALNLTESTVRTRLHRARQMLRDEIASRLEDTLENTAPGKSFTKAVMVAIGGAAIGLSAGANAADTTAAASSNTIAAVMSTVTAKIITAAAVITVITGAAFLYTHSGSDTPPQPTEQTTQSQPASPQAQRPENAKPLTPAVTKSITESSVDPEQAINILTANVETQNDQDNSDTETAIIASNIESMEKSGYVFEPNGVLSGLITGIETGQPVTDAEVTITSNRRYRTTTDENGFYRFETIEKNGDYTIGVYSNEYVGVTVYSEQPRLHIKTDSQAVKHFQLSKACMVNVYVVDETQNPIKDVRVWTTSLADEHGVETGHSYVSRGTNEDGYIQLGGFKPSETPYMVHALHTRYGEWITKNGRRFKESFCDYAPGYVKLKLTDPDVIEYAEIVLAKGESIRGFAHYADGSPAAGCEIVPYPDWWHSNYSPPSWPIDPNGLFTLEQIIPGAYRIQARVPMGSSSSTGYTLFSLQLPQEKQKLLSVTVPRKPTNEDPTRNAGSTDSKLYGMVMDAATGKPIPKFRLRYKRLGLSHTSAEGKWTQFENSKGSFTMDVIGTETPVCQVQAVADGYASQWSQPIDTADNRAVLMKLTKGGSITGVIVDAKGDPVADAHVMPHSLAGGVMSAGEPVFESDEGAVNTDSRGRFRLNNVAPGSETLKIAHPDYSESLVSDVTVQEGKQNDVGKIILNKGGTIDGLVYDNLGNPQGGVTLYVQNHYGFSSSEIQYAQVLTEPNGYYQIQNLPNTLCYVVRPRAYEQNGVVSRAIIPSANQITRLDLGGGPVVTGRLVVDGKPLAQTRVLLTLGQSMVSGLYRCHAETDDDGRFVLSAARPGLYTLSYDRRTKLSTSTTTKLLDFSINPLDELIELGTVPVQEQSLQLWIQSADELLETISYFYIRQNEPLDGPCVFWKDEPKAGEMPYTIGLPASGTYYAVVRYGGGFYEHRYPIEVTADQTLVEVILPLTPGTVTLTGALPEQVNHVWFTNDDRSVSGLLYNNSETGGFRIENLLPGTYYFCPKWANWQDSIVRTIPNTTEFKLNLDLDELQAKLTERLTVHVFGPDGLPVLDTNVWIETDGQNQMPVYRDQYSGVFYLPGGEHIIHAEKEEFKAMKTYRLTIDPYNTASGESYEEWVQLK